MTPVPSETNSAILELNTGLSLRKLALQIDRLDLSADVKSLLMDLSRITMKVGEAVLQIGRKILSVALEIVARFPNTVFGVVVGVAVALLVGSLPMLGGLLGAFVMPLAMAYGLTRGALADLANEAWASRIEDIEAQLLKVVG